MNALTEIKAEEAVAKAVPAENKAGGRAGTGGGAGGGGAPTTGGLAAPAVHTTRMEFFPNRMFIESGYCCHPDRSVLRRR